MGFRAAPACAATATALVSAAATRAEQRRCLRLCPQLLVLLLLLLLSLGQLHAVQVMNVPVVPESSATAMNKITIIFKAHRECADQKVYQAVTDDLPTAFVDGTTSGGDGEAKSLHMVETAWPGYTLETANTQCHEKMTVKDFYFQSCVFDLLTTGDANFTTTTHSPLEDVEALHPRKERRHIFPSSGNGTPRGGSDLSVSLGLTCLILVVFL
ncbi:RGM domain family member B [Sciurus carolinensis]|uniref:RGM domain family member B n=1 Tax=Sciurus carolinensis TaxID=30640 RepID=A0AA41T665_SCICA|nr:RGM domain family member B [Sciurus carolinensis]